jgi:large subunit ribosomal protein L17
MRHRKKINSLGRKAAHRNKTLSNLAASLILHKRINTTVAKAKALRVYVEPLITKSKEDSTHSRRTVFSYLRNKYAVSELFREVSSKIAERPGGYTRILKTGFRKGDGAEMCFIELVDYNTHMLTSGEDTQQKRTRRGRRSGKTAQSDTTEQGQVKKETKTVSTTEQVEKTEAEAVDTVEKPVIDTPEVQSEAEVTKESPEAETTAETTAEAPAEPVEDKKVAEESKGEAGPKEEKTKTSEENEKDKDAEK